MAKKLSTKGFIKAVGAIVEVKKDSIAKGHDAITTNEHILIAIKKSNLLSTVIKTSRCGRTDKEIMVDLIEPTIDGKLSVMLIDTVLPDVVYAGVFFTTKLGKQQYQPHLNGLAVQAWG